MNAVDEWTQSHTGGQTAAILSKVCGGDTEKLDDLLRGSLEVELKKALKKFFDQHGRRIPEGLSANVCDADRSFRLDQPRLAQEVDYANCIIRLRGAFADVDIVPNLVFGITTQQLKQEIERLLGLIRGNSQIANIINGIWLPVIMPQLTTDDLGRALEQYLEAVGKSYAKTFNDRLFCNYCKGILAGDVSVALGSRHDQLIAKMKQGPVIGIQFSNSLWGFSVNASREQMWTLPEGFILSSLDTPIAMAMYPDILARGWDTPGLNLAALSWRSADCSLGFRARDDRLIFGSTDDLANADGRYSGGLFFCG